MMSKENPITYQCVHNARYYFTSTCIINYNISTTPYNGLHSIKSYDIQCIKKYHMWRSGVFLIVDTNLVTLTNSVIINKLYKSLILN